MKGSASPESTVRAGIPWMRIVSVTFMALGLAFCVYTLLGADVEQYRNLLSPKQIVMLIIVTLGALATSTLAWRYYFEALSTIRLPIGEAFYQLGIVLVGKYVPIILGGVLARVGANASRTSASNVIAATLLEQCGAIASAGCVGIACIAFATYAPLGVAIAITALAATAFVPAVARPAVSAMHWLRAKIRRRDDFEATLVGRRPVRLAWLAQLAQWIVLSLLAALVIRGLRPDVEPLQTLFVVGAFALAVVVGIAAFVFPGGIGAREAAFVWMVGHVVGYDTALIMATTLRIATTGIDLVAGAGCLLHGVMHATDKRPIDPA